MGNPFFSIIVTIFNKDKWLERCIESILIQTYKNYELILINDGSTDDSKRICEKYSLNAQVKYYEQDNQGLTVARKKGIKKSNGEYILFVDADDYVDNMMLENYMKYIDAYQPDIIIDSLIKEYSETNKSRVNNRISTGYYDINRIKDEVIPKMIYTGRFFEKGIESYICARVLKKEILVQLSVDINNRIGFAEGGVWIYGAIMKARSLFICEDYHYHYCMNDESLAMKKVGNEEILLVCNNLKQMNRKYLNNSAQILMQIYYFANYLLIWQDIGILNETKEELYPYLDIKKGSKVIIYGAWRFGRKLIEYVKNNEIWEIVMVVDKNYKKHEKSEGIDVYPIRSILDADYDYIVLGSLVYSVIDSMKNDLNKLGITQRIVCVDTSNVVIERLPKGYVEE